MDLKEFINIMKESKDGYNSLLEISDKLNIKLTTTNDNKFIIDNILVSLLEKIGLEVIGTAERNSYVIFRKDNTQIAFNSEYKNNIGMILPDEYNIVYIEENNNKEIKKIEK